MRRPVLMVVLVIFLAGGALGAMSTPSYAQAYGGYNYPPPPQNIYATPWVGANTPWVFYQGDWFLNGILHQFFGNQYGWAPYYAYPPTYIVRPYTWYAPRWNAWYKGNPHYWRTFQQQYPYWRGHRVGQRYDQTFYNTHHRGQGDGWNQGVHGVRPPVVQGPAVRDHRAPGGPGVPAPVAPGRGARDPRATGPGSPPVGATTPGVRPHGTPGPGGPPAGGAGPVVHAPGGKGNGGPPAQAASPGGRAPGATGPGVNKPEKTPRGVEKPQQ
jgi:hypothetical protein